MTPENDVLLIGLIDQGCTTKAIEGTTLISLPEDEAEFIFERMGNWLYLGTTFMAPEEFETSNHVSGLDRFLLELQHRNLGCRFSYDSAGYLTIGSRDCDAAEQTPGAHCHCDECNMPVSMTA